MRIAISILKGEHQSIAAVLHGLRYLVDELAAGRAKPDFQLLGAMLRYIEEFPDRLHHPQEEAHLFRLLRLRDPASAVLLDELQREHALSYALRDDLVRTLGSYREGTPGALEAFSRALESYARLHWSHMNKEEDRVIPAALRTLTDADWTEIEQAIAPNQDPLGGVSLAHEYRDLFRRIVAMAPPPIGVGPSAPG
jgi:hemerythrin-like domain-containing protein